MKMSTSRIAAGVAALAFVAGTASAQLEYYAIATDGSLIYSDGAGSISVVGNVGINNTVNTLAVNWQHRGGDGNFYTSYSYTNAAPFSTPSGNVYDIDVSDASTTSAFDLSDTVAGLPFGGGMAFDSSGNMWQISSNFAGATTLTSHDTAGNLLTSVNVGITGTFGALHLRSDGVAIVGANDGTIYTVDMGTGAVVGTKATGFAWTEFSSGPRAADGFFSGIPNWSATWQDVVYGVANAGGIASIYRVNVFGNAYILQENIDLAALGVSGNIWGLQVVPAPASAALIGLGGLVATRRRRG